MPQGNQVKNGKAFEYAIAKEYLNYVCQEGKKAVLVDNEACRQAKVYYDEFDDVAKQKFDKAARETIDTMTKIEPGILAAKNDDDTLQILLQKDQEGERGDVRDIVLLRCGIGWEIGFSAKNNNDAVKHSRLSKSLDFGKKWLGYECSQLYWNEVAPVFDLLENIKTKDRNILWSAMGESKQNEIYVPLLIAFKNEMMRINEKETDVPARLISYLIGEYPFYKIIKDDAHNMVIVKAFNINGELNKTVNKVKSRYSIPEIKLPTRIVEFEFKQDSKDTLNMILDGGWEVSFRIHNASSKVETSLKFDVRLLGNPPILFTQHLFQ